MSFFISLIPTTIMSIISFLESNEKKGTEIRKYYIMTAKGFLIAVIANFMYILDISNDVVKFIIIFIAIILIFYGYLKRFFYSSKK